MVAGTLGSGIEVITISSIAAKFGPLLRNEITSLSTGAEDSAFGVVTV